MLSDLKHLYQFRDLLRMWTEREIRIRYKQSLLGAAWAILQPLALMVVFTIVATFLRRGIPTDGIPYPVFYYTALLPWTFFTTSIMLGAPSLVNNLSLVVKTNFPREILPLGSIGASFFDYLVASSIFIMLLLIYQVQVGWTVLWLPLILLLQILLTVGVTLLCAALIVRFRDIRFTIPLVVQILLFMTPIIYPATIVPERLRFIFMMNPMAGIIESYRKIVLYAEPPLWNDLLLSGIVAVIVAAFGYRTFKRLEISFADII